MRSGVCLCLWAFVVLFFWLLRTVFVRLYVSFSWVMHR